MGATPGSNEPEGVRGRSSHHDETAFGEVLDSVVSKNTDAVPPPSVRSYAVDQGSLERSGSAEPASESGLDALVNSIFREATDMRSSTSRAVRLVWRVAVFVAVIKLFKHGMDNFVPPVLKLALCVLLVLWLAVQLPNLTVLEVLSDVKNLPVVGQFAAGATAASGCGFWSYKAYKRRR